MTVYLASPGNEIQANAVRDCPVLLSYAVVTKSTPWIDRWAQSFGRLLIDSGAYSEMNSGVSVDLSDYVEWASRYEWADAWAGLDDIRGDWRRSLKNYEAGGFPTMHDTDPDDLLPDLIDIARERSKWLGIGLSPPRSGKEAWLRRTLDRVPDGLHVHGFALSAYDYLPRFDSFDSTHWWREAMKIVKALPWLTYGEALEITVKKMQRARRRIAVPGSLPLLETP